jgi:curved DNA-binding protein CbpA
MRQNGVKTFYEIIGVPQGATQNQITEAYRRLVREHHPDRYQDLGRKAETEQFLMEVTEAFNTLSKPHLRQEYDRSLAAPRQAPTHQKSPHEQALELLPQGLARMRGGDESGALALMDHILWLEPENDQALFYAGMMRLKSAKTRVQGSQQVEKAIEKNPFRSEYATHYAAFLLENGLKLRAQRLLETALQNAPGDADLLGLLAQAKGEKAPGASFFRKKL